MALESDISNFSNRRGLQQERSSQEKEWDEDENYDNDEDEWDEEDDFGFNFNMYELNQLAQLNREIESNDVLLIPLWKAFRHYFKKGTLSKVGIILMKIKKLVTSDNFEGVSIQNVNQSLHELTVFAKHLFTLHKQRTVSNIMSILFFFMMEYWTDWTIFWYFMVAWYLFDTINIQFVYKRRKAWMAKAREYVASQEGMENSSTLNEKRSNVEGVLEFNRYIATEQQESWAVRLYDAVASLFKK
jgi:hypothetical protein